jgi:WS/DGAT/MGAT family acyltransferase
VSLDSLTPLDATFLELEEADDAAHMHIGSVAVFEQHRGAPPTLDRLRRHLETRLSVLPHYRCRLSEPHTGGLHWPAWIEDPDFDIAEHVSEAKLPAPGGEAELVAWAGDYWSRRLDRRRSLWHTCLLTGLEGGRWAIASKTHHAMVDGVGSMDVSHLVLDATRRPRRTAPPEQAAAPAAADGSHGPLGLLMSGVQGGLHAARHPGRLRDAFLQAKATAEVILKDEVLPAPKSSVNAPIGADRRYLAVRADLADVKAIKQRLGGTVNDVVLAAATSGLRELLLARGDAPPHPGLRAMVPVNIRTADQALDFGNRVTSLFVELPVDEEDTLERYARTLHSAETLKSGTQAEGGSTLVDLAALAPPVLHSFLARSLFAKRLFNVTVTNVKGPQETVYCLGCPLREIYPLVPLAAEHAVGIAVVSYDGRLFFGLVGDHDVVPEMPVMREVIEESLEELRALANGGTRVKGGVS